ncbi:hypothetical protein ACFQ07_13455 [Actinomadura adrarensis]|uniref:Uncharacterized protein n=1 Tax=Actinomadura adrarensis TaxID=1819600 RepID=A0ABW3CGY9_9ACTN
MSPIDDWNEYGVVFTNGAGSFLTILFVVLAVLAFVGFIVRVILHENHAYAEIEKNEPVERGPVVEGEPQAY